MDLARLVRRLGREYSSELVLRCYRKYERPNPSPETPSVVDIENLFVFGEYNQAHLIRDITQRKSDYHIPRTMTKDIHGSVDEGISIILITGEICDGKTLIVEELCAQLSLTRPIFIMRHPYNDLIEETTTILNEYKDSVAIIENCFDLSPQKLAKLARLFSNSSALLILTSRNIAAEAEAADIDQLENFRSFRQFIFEKLDNEEMDALINLADQLAAWAEFYAQTIHDRRRFIKQVCNGSLPSFFLRVLKSKYVRDIYQKEYRKASSLNPSAVQAVIASLYVAHIGHDAPLSFLSNAFEEDIGAIVERLNRQDMLFKLVRREGDCAKTVPSIGATNILRYIVESKDIVDTVVRVLQYLSEDAPYDDFSRYMFGQMMRYSILSSVISEIKHINRFFDNVSKISKCREQILFWLQWHMAKTNQREYHAAERYLRQGYAKAESYERRVGRAYDKRQLDDRRAKFLMIRGSDEGRENLQIFHDFHEACAISRRLLSLPEITHHPFETLCEILKFLQIREHELHADQKKIAWKSLGNLVDLAEKRVGNLRKGYQTYRAQRSLSLLTQIEK